MMVTDWFEPWQHLRLYAKKCIIIVAFWKATLGQALLKTFVYVLPGIPQNKLSHIASAWKDQEKSTCKAPVPSFAPPCAVANTEQQ